MQQSLNVWFYLLLLIFFVPKLTSIILIFPEKKKNVHNDINILDFQRTLYCIKTNKNKYIV